MSQTTSRSSLQGMKPATTGGQGLVDQLKFPPADLSTREIGRPVIQRRGLRPCCDGGRAMGSGQSRANGGLPKWKLTVFVVGIRGVPPSKLVSTLSSAESK